MSGIDPNGWLVVCWIEKKQKKGYVYLRYTPKLNINMEPKHEGGWKMIFLFNWVVFRFHVFFSGVYLYLYLYIHIYTVYIYMSMYTLTFQFGYQMVVKGCQFHISYRRVYLAPLGRCWYKEYSGISQTL